MKLEITQSVNSDSSWCYWISSGWTIFWQESMRPARQSLEPCQQAPLHCAPQHVPGPDHERLSQTLWHPQRRARTGSAETEQCYSGTTSACRHFGQLVRVRWTRSPTPRFWTSPWGTRRRRRAAWTTATIRSHTGTFGSVYSPSPRETHQIWTIHCCYWSDHHPTRNGRHWTLRPTFIWISG
jgi:hypothetical protein